MNELLSAPNNEQKLRRFAEALINYQLYAELHAYDNKQKQKRLLDERNESKAVPNKEALPDVRSSFGLDDIDLYDEAELINIEKDLSKMRENI